MKAFLAHSIYGNLSKPGFLAKLCLFVLLFLSNVAAQAQIRLIPNQGQWPERILYKADVPGGVFYIEKDTLTYYFFDGNALHHALHDNKPIESFRGHVLRVGFPGSNGIKKAISTGAESPEYYNYFLGNDKSKWASNV